MNFGNGGALRPASGLEFFPTMAAGEPWRPKNREGLNRIHMQDKVHNQTSD